MVDEGLRALGYEPIASVAVRFPRSVLTSRSDPVGDALHHRALDRDRDLDRRSNGLRFARPPAPRRRWCPRVSVAAPPIATRLVTLASTSAKRASICAVTRYPDGPNFGPKRASPCTKEFRPCPVRPLSHRNRWCEVVCIWENFFPRGVRAIQNTIFQGDHRRTEVTIPRPSQSSGSITSVFGCEISTAPWPFTECSGSPWCAAPRATMSRLFATSTEWSSISCSTPMPAIRPLTF